MMGHSNIRSTQTYAKITDDNIGRDMDRLIQRRKAKGLSHLDRDTAILLDTSTLKQ